MWTAAELSTPTEVKRVSFWPRIGYTNRIVNGHFQGSHDQSTWTDLHIISTAHVGAWNEADLSNTAAYKYYRFLSPHGGHCNIAEIRLYA